VRDKQRMERGRCELLVVARNAPLSVT